MFESIMNKIKKITKKEDQTLKSKDAAKERLHLVLMQDRANVSADFLDLMKQEIIEVIKKYIDIDESAMDVRLTNKENGDGTNGAPALYANIPILNIKDEARQTVKFESNKTEKNEYFHEEYNYIDINNQRTEDYESKDVSINNNRENLDNEKYNYEESNEKETQFNNYENINNNIQDDCNNEEKEENTNIVETEKNLKEEEKKEEIKIENNSNKQNNNYQQQNRNFKKHNKNFKKHKHKKY